jgi:hypothetical protein
MENSFTFFLAIIAAYASACFVWLGIYKFYPTWWPVAIIEKPASRYKDLLIAIGSCVGIMLIGQLYSAGLLLPDSDNPYLAALLWSVNNLIIYSPIFITLYLRRQSVNTVFLSSKMIAVKLVFGLVASVIGIEIFYLIADSEGQLSSVLAASLLLDNIRNFPAVFLEGVAIAFLFVRLNWSVGKKWAILIPAILFALAHLPRSIGDGTAVPDILAYSAVTFAVTVLILYTSHKSRDVIWLGVIHYLMDIAIGAFN